MDFETVYTELFTPLYRYVFFRVKNYDESMDIIQSVFTKVFQNYKDKSRTELEKLLYRSARNEIIDRGIKKKAIIVDPAESFWNTVPDELVHDPEQESICNENHTIVTELLELLEDHEREVIILKYIQEKEYYEIAELLGKQEAAVRQIVSRGIKKMKEKYEIKS